MGKRRTEAAKELPDTPEETSANLLPLADDEGIDPYQRDSLHAEEALQRGADAAPGGDERAAIEQYLRAAKIAETAREWYVAAVALQRVGEFLEDPKPPCDLERALRTYRRALAAYEHCGLFDEARQLGYRIQYLRMTRGAELRLSPWVRAELAAYWLLAGFGYRPLRVIASSAVLVLAYAALYVLVGGVRDVAAGGSAAGFWDSLYFSGITFSTVGYGDLVPAPHARLLALTEGALGAFLIGFFVVILSKRLRH